MAEASADPAIQRYNGVLDRLGYPEPPLSLADAEGPIDGFAGSWDAFAVTGTPRGLPTRSSKRVRGAWSGAVGSTAGPAPTWRSSATGSPRAGADATTPLA